MATITSPKVVRTVEWEYGLSMPSTSLSARVDSKVWSDGVVISTCYGEDERGSLSVGTFRGTLTRVEATYWHPVQWRLRDEAFNDCGLFTSRPEALQWGGNLAVHLWADPIRVRIAAAERLAADEARQHRVESSCSNG